MLADSAEEIHREAVVVESAAVAVDSAVVVPGVSAEETRREAVLVDSAVAVLDKGEQHRLPAEASSTAFSECHRTKE